MAAQLKLTDIYYYPVKGLTPQRLESVEVTKGNPLPWDRAFAIENGPSGFDPQAPAYLPKTRFLMLMRDERLATLKTNFDPASGMLEIMREGKRVAGGNITTPIGRTLVEQFFAAFSADDLKGAPRLLSALDPTGNPKGHHAFTDIAARYVSIINLASVRDLERLTGKAVNPLRFRGNLMIDGLEPWQELSLVGREILIGGNVRLTVRERTTRCPATNVDPETGARDMTIPPTISGAFGHKDCGVYAEITAGGLLASGAAVEIGEKEEGPELPF